MIAWLQRRGVATIATIHDIVPFGEGADVTSGRDSALHRIYRRLSGIIVNSAFALNALAELDPAPAKKAAVIPPGSYTDYAQAAARPRAEARAKLDLPLHDPLILVFGTIKPNKRLDLALRALPQIGRAHPNARLVVAGKPRETDVAGFIELARQLGVAGQVIWRLHFIEDADAPLYYSAADALLFPYQWIYQSAVLLMAMSFGKAVVATDVGGTPEFIRHNQTGLLIPPDSSEAIAQALIRLLDQPELAAALGQAALRFAGDELSWDNPAALTKDFYQRILAQPGGVT